MANRDTKSGHQAAEAAEIIHGLLAKRRLVGRAAEAAGLDRKYFNELATRKNGIHLGAFLAALEELGMHPIEFFQLYFAPSPENLVKGQLERRDLEP